MNKSYTYTYDNAGNRISKGTYAFTTGTLGTVQSTMTYAYGDNNWGDKLTSYTSGNTTQNIEYDEIGNPTFIGRGVVGSSSWNGNAMEWSGRNLISFREEKGRGGSLDCIYTETFYTYNADGIRTSKWNDGVSYTYCLEGSRIIVETVVDSEFEYELFYLYDANGSPIGMQYREPSMAQDVFYTYWFEKNLQGDIVAVYNDSGVKIITYTYDAWGNFTGNWINASGTNIYAMYNPFRYRGYYYDTETGFYYLNSRYYNPEWGRFINADGYVSTGTGLLGYNMYAYCNNNPVMYVDPDGEFPFLILAIVVVVAVVAVTMTSCAPTSVDVDENFDLNSKSKYKYNTYEEAVMAAASDVSKKTEEKGCNYEYAAVVFQYANDSAYYYNGTTTSSCYNYVNYSFPNGTIPVAIVHSHCNDTLREPYGADGLGKEGNKRIDSFIVIPPSAYGNDTRKMKIYCLPANAIQLDQFYVYYP